MTLATISSAAHTACLQPRNSGIQIKHVLSPTVYVGLAHTGIDTVPVHYTGIFAGDGNSGTFAVCLLQGDHPLGE
jgi:hypothetical protein